MDTIVGDYYLENSRKKNSTLINFGFNTQDYLVYEVLRTKKGKLIFLEDHMERLKNSLSGISIHSNSDTERIQIDLQQLVTLNDNREGNVKILCKIVNRQLYYTAYYIPHEYPPEEMYRQGVKLITYKIERSDPDIKQVHVSEYIRKKIETARIKASAYEVLLKNNTGHITEGSKSNIFLVHNGELYSPPDEYLLPGITRKYVFQIARELMVPIYKKPIGYDEIKKYESAFICGTSPKILPVNTIDSNILQVKNEIIDLIISKYNTIIQEYIGD